MPASANLFACQVSVRKPRSSRNTCGSAMTTQGRSVETNFTRAVVLGGYSTNIARNQFFYTALLDVRPEQHRYNPCGTRLLPGRQFLTPAAFQGFRKTAKLLIASREFLYLTRRHRDREPRH